MLSIIVMAVMVQGAAEISGDVQLSCALDHVGRLQACRVVEETPKGRGFGGAALEVSRRLKIEGRGRGRTTMPVRFRMSAAEAEPLGILPPGSPPLVEGAPVTRPTRRQVMGYFPAQARRDGQPGRALVRCTVEADGELDGCRVLKETPEGRGFGAAAVELVEALYRAPTTDRTGATTGRPAIVWVDFALPD